MKTAKLIRNGGGQVVCLPQEFCFKGEEVEIFRRGDEVVLRPISAAADAEAIFEALAGLRLNDREAGV
ncbi:MAG: antitoxin [Pigmentiphaga sp.]